MWNEVSTSTKSVFLPAQISPAVPTLTEDPNQTDPNHSTAANNKLPIAPTKNRTKSSIFKLGIPAPPPKRKNSTIPCPTP